VPPKKKYIVFVVAAMNQPRTISLWFCIAFSVIIAWFQLCSPRVTAVQPAKISMSIEASHKGDFLRVHPWQLKVGPDRRGKLVIYRAGGDVRKSVVVAEKDFNEVAKSLEENKFFELPKEVGVVIPDGDERVLDVTLGKNRHRIVINHLRLAEQPTITKQEYATAKRVVLIWAKVRGLFEDGDAIDIRDIEKDLLEKSKP